MENRALATEVARHRSLRLNLDAGKKESALEWFRRLERRYEENIEKPGEGRRECLCGGSLDVTATHLLLHRYIRDLAPDRANAM